jgi:predicted RNA polymerase sigma factor
MPESRAHGRKRRGLCENAVRFCSGYLPAMLPRTLRPMLSSVLVAATLLAPLAHAEPITETLDAAQAAAPEAQQPPPDPQRWLPLTGLNGMISYFDRESVKRRGSEVGVELVHNVPAGGAIRTTSGEPIRSSLKRIVLNCATSMYALAEQTLFTRRNARGDSLYTVRYPDTGMPKLATGGTVAGQLLSRLCQ